MTLHKSRLHVIIFNQSALVDNISQINRLTDVVDWFNWNSQSPNLLILTSTFFDSGPHWPQNWDMWDRALVKLRQINGFDKSTRTSRTIHSKLILRQWTGHYQFYSKMFKSFENILNMFSHVKKQGVYIKSIQLHCIWTNSCIHFIWIRLYMLIISWCKGSIKICIASDSVHCAEKYLLPVNTFARCYNICSDFFFIYFFFNFFFK